MRFLSLIVIGFLAHASWAQSFSELLDAVGTTDASEHAGLVSDFASTASFPYLENDTTAVFLYLGSASSVAVSGDFNGWSGQGWSLDRLASTNLWYRIEHFERDARLDYKIIRNGSSWILDPRNPNQVPGGFGANSELAMPGYEQPWEITDDPAIANGVLHSHSFTSSVMGNSRTVRVYTPAGYDPDRAEPYPVILYHDGSDYLNLASIETVLDNLIDAGRIEPIVAVFANPLNREQEYATTRTADFTRLIVEELMPWVEANYHVSSDPTHRAVTGPSYAGLASARHCFEHPDEFGLCAPFSPSFWVSDGELLDTIAAGDPTPIKWYVDWGTYESSIATTGRIFETVLTQHGASFQASEWHEGHSWGSWRAHQDIMLEYFFPGVNATSRSSVEQPSNNLGLSVYPNPSRGSTTIAFDTLSAGPVEVAIYDLLGRRVETLIDRTVPPGSHRAQWNPVSEAAGTYLVRVTSGSASISRLVAMVP